MKIYLIGYMGSGKSTIGMRLAKLMSLDFIDFDSSLEKETGKPITEIFNTWGENKFRELEHEHLKNLLAKEKVVISLGGGTPCFYNNMDLINKTGTSVYLKMDVNTLVQRLLKAKNKRPLIRDLNELELNYFIEANLEKRKAIYEQSHFTVNASGLNVEESIEKIIKKVK